MKNRTVRELVQGSYFVSLFLAVTGSRLGEDTERVYHERYEQSFKDVNYFAIYSLTAHNKKEKLLRITHECLSNKENENEKKIRVSFATHLYGLLVIWGKYSGMTGISWESIIHKDDSCTVRTETALEVNSNLSD